MKKLLSSRWMPVAFGVLLFVCTLAILGYFAKQMVTESTALKEQKEQIKAEREARAKADANATQAMPTIEDAGKTETQEKHEAEQVDQEQIIESSFSILHGMTDPGQLRFDNPSLPPLMTALARQRDYQLKRAGELLELEAHIQEQLQELHWHTNRITQSQAELDKLFEGRFNFFKQQEVERLQNLARIYESMDSDDPEFGAKMGQFLQANQLLDKTLNAKIFLYLTPSIQAKILEELVTGTAANVLLYQDIIGSLMKTMPGPGVDPPTPPTP
jgi:flagellar motility protein MotE (MotC chaperone)